MERAAAVVVAGIGLILLTLTAMVFAGPDENGRAGGVQVAALVTRPPVALGSPPAARRAAPGATASTGSVAAPPTSPTTAPSAPTAPSPATAPLVTTPPLPAGLVELLADISAGGIRFAFGQADLDSRAQALLDRLGPLLVGRPDVAIVVRGHTDSVGSAEVNGALSTRRAQVVAEYLMGRGVPAGQIQVAGFGADLPIADNVTDQGRQANRRSEVTAMERGG